MPVIDLLSKTHSSQYNICNTAGIQILQLGNLVKALINFIKFY